MRRCTNGANCGSFFSSTSNDRPTDSIWMVMTMTTQNITWLLLTMPSTGEQCSNMDNMTKIKQKFIGTYRWAYIELHKLIAILISTDSEYPLILPKMKKFSEKKSARNNPIIFQLNCFNEIAFFFTLSLFESRYKRIKLSIRLISELIGKMPMKCYSFATFFSSIKLTWKNEISNFLSHSQYEPKKTKWWTFHSSFHQSIENFQFRLIDFLFVLRNSLKIESSTRKNQ